MEPNSRQLELLIKLEPLELEPDWVAGVVGPGPDSLAPPVQPEPRAAAVKTEAGRPGGPEQAARAGAGPGRWLAAVRLSAADRAAAEAQLPRQQSPALAPVKQEAYIDPKLEFADVTGSSGDSNAEFGAQSSENWEPPEPSSWTRGLGGEFLRGGRGQPPLCRRCDGLGLRRCAGPGAEPSCRLQQHAAAQHPDSTARSCPDRGQTSAQQPKDNPLQCQQCGKAFAYQSALQRHERVHSGARPFVCPDCGAGFNQKITLQLHSRTHTGEKPHRCAQCGRGFAQLGTLRRHERTHTGAHPYACSDCGRRFTRAESLRTHQRAVHLEQRPHACSDCGQQFSQLGNLRAHQQAVHLKQRSQACSDGRSAPPQPHPLEPEAVQLQRQHVRIHLRELGPMPARPSVL